MLFFELFPAVFAIFAFIVGVMLFAANRRARNNPHERDLPRPPSQPDVSPEAAAAEAAGTARRPSMRA